MSFSNDIKNEMARKEPEEKCCQLAEIAGFIRLNGSIKLEGAGKFSIVMQTENPAIARHYKTLIKKYFDVNMNLENEQTYFNTTLHKLIITPEMNSDQILRETGILIVREGLNTISDGINELIIKTKCCRKSYLRGLFMARGSINNPQKGYHVEIVSTTEVLAKDIRKLFNSFVDIYAAISKRKEEYVIYLKSAEQIKDILNIIGAHVNLLEYENIRIIKEMRNKANRINNCDGANLDRCIEAASKQVEAIEKVGIENLPAKLQELARARVENPSLSYAELGNIMDPPVKKATVQYRLKKIEEICRETL